MSSYTLYVGGPLSYYLLLKGRSSKITELSQIKKHTTPQDLPTAHCGLNKHINNLHFKSENVCLFCLEEEERVVHELCEGLKPSHPQRILLRGEDKPMTASWELLIAYEVNKYRARQDMLPRRRGGTGHKAHNSNH